MKLYKYLISGGLALTLSLSSCESWLEVEPNDTRMPLLLSARSDG